MNSPEKPKSLKIQQILPEIKISTAVVNSQQKKLAEASATQVTLTFNVLKSKILSLEEKESIQAKHGKKLTKEGAFVVSCDSARTLEKNKSIAFKKLSRLLSRAYENSRKSDKSS